MVVLVRYTTTSPFTPKIVGGVVPAITMPVITPEIANVPKTSIGPRHTDKMLIRYVMDMNKVADVEFRVSSTITAFVMLASI